MAEIHSRNADLAPAIACNVTKRSGRRPKTPAFIFQKIPQSESNPYIAHHLMQSPVCAYCGKILRNPQKSAELVAFRMTGAQARYNEEHDVQKLLGHPAGMDWFCRKHAPKARRFSHLTLGEAIRQLNEQQTLGEKWMKVFYTLLFSHRQ